MRRSAFVFKIATFTSLYPNAAQPQHGLFVEHRLRQLLACGAVSASVVAPVPWFPFRAGVFGRYATFASVPPTERRHGIELVHPRYPVIPAIGMNIAPALMARWCRPAVERLRAGGAQLIDAHYFYPDGVAAAKIAHALSMPFLVTARGSDVNVIAGHTGPRRQILAAAAQAARVITVSRALRDRLIDLGVRPERIVVLRNGVDRRIFRPVARETARAATGMKGSTLLSVGNLIELKGHHLVIAALAGLPGTDLVIVGDGPDLGELQSLAGRLGVAPRVRFTGSIPQAELVNYYAAADALVLASSREGMANVLLEAMACGTPVVATAVSGNPEVVSSRHAGVLVHERTADALATAIRELLAAPPTSAQVVEHAAQFSWQATTQGQLELLREILG